MKFDIYIVEFSHKNSFEKIYRVVFIIITTGCYVRVSFTFIFLHQKIFDIICVCFLKFLFFILLYHLLSVLVVFSVILLLAAILPLFEYVHVKITIIFRYSNYNIMPTSASTVSAITVCCILNKHNMSNVDSDYHS